jgi:hypothetical protein
MDNYRRPKSRRRWIILLVLFVTTIAGVSIVAVRSSRYRYVFTLRIDSNTCVWIESVTDGVQLVYRDQVDTSADATGWTSNEPADSMVENKTFGVGLINSTIPIWMNGVAYNARYIAILVPYWLLLLLMGVLVAYSLLRYRRNRASQGTGFDPSIVNATE